MTHKPHILFVDDEQRILDGLRRMLRGRRDRWDMSFANGGIDALAVLAERHCDVVVSDFRMPEMDGAALLEKVRTASPDTARIILSGQTSADNIMRVMTLAHQFINKPATADQLIEAIEYLLGAQVSTTATGENLGDASGVTSLPSPPALLAELLSVLDDEQVSASSIGKVVQTDPAVAAKILHLANSSAMTAGQRLSDVTQAIALLGTNNVRGLVLLHDIVTAFADRVHLPMSWMESLNAHSVQTAQLAGRLSANRPWSAQSFTAGLLHEVGQLVLATSRPDEFGIIIATWQRATAAAAASETPQTADVTASPALCELELAELHTSHAEAGASLLSLWGLPAGIVDAAARHVTADMPTTAVDLSSAVALAHAAVEAHLGPVCGARPTRPFDDEPLGAIERTVIQRWRSSLQPE